MQTKQRFNKCSLTLSIVLELICESYPLPLTCRRQNICINLVCKWVYQFILCPLNRSVPHLLQYFLHIPHSTLSDAFITCTHVTTFSTVVLSNCLWRCLREETVNEGFAGEWDNEKSNKRVSVGGVMKSFLEETLTSLREGDHSWLWIFYFLDLHLFLAVFHLCPYGIWGGECKFLLSLIN